MELRGCFCGRSGHRYTGWQLRARSWLEGGKEKGVGIFKSRGLSHHRLPWLRGQCTQTTRTWILVMWLFWCTWGRPAPRPTPTGYVGATECQWQSRPLCRKWSHRNPSCKKNRDKKDVTGSAKCTLMGPRIPIHWRPAVDRLFPWNGQNTLLWLAQIL